MKIDLHERGVIGLQSFIATVEIEGETRQANGLPDIVVWRGRFFGRHSLIGSSSNRPVYDERTAVAVKEPG